MGIFYFIFSSHHSFMIVFSSMFTGVDICFWRLNAFIYAGNSEWKAKHQKSLNILRVTQISNKTIHVVVLQYICISFPLGNRAML